MEIKNYKHLDEKCTRFVDGLIEVETDIEVINQTIELLTLGGGY